MGGPDEIVVRFSLRGSRRPWGTTAGESSSVAGDVAHGLFRAELAVRETAAAVDLPNTMLARVAIC